MQASDKIVQQRVATALARLAKCEDLKRCFVARRGLDILLELLTDQRKDQETQKEAAGVWVAANSCCMLMGAAKLFQELHYGGFQLCDAWMF